jgi:hypothetical protein
MAITVESVRLRMNAVAEATPAERRHRMVDLMTAGVELRDRMAKLQQWLVDADAYLTAHPNLADFTERENRYLERLRSYQEMHDVLGAALEMIGADGQIEREPVREQLAP